MKIEFDFFFWKIWNSSILQSDLLTTKRVTRSQTVWGFYGEQVGFHFSFCFWKMQKHFLSFWKFDLNIFRADRFVATVFPQQRTNIHFATWQMFLDFLPLSPQKESEREVLLTTDHFFPISGSWLRGKQIGRETNLNNQMSYNFYVWVRIILSFPTELPELSFGSASQFLSSRLTSFGAFAFEEEESLWKNGSKKVEI